MSKTVTVLGYRISMKLTAIFARIDHPNRGSHPSLLGGGGRAA